MPVSCSKCNLKYVQLSEKDSVHSLLRRFYIPVYRECTIVGNVEAV